MKRKPSTGTTTLWYKLITSFENIHLCDKGPNSDHGVGVWPSDSAPLLLLDRAAHLDKGLQLEKSSQLEIFSNLTGLPTLVILALWYWIHEWRSTMVKGKRRLKRSQMLMKVTLADQRCFNVVPL